MPNSKRIPRAVSWLCGLCVIVTTGVAALSNSYSYDDTDNDTGTVGGANGPVYLSQGWSEEMRELFYYTAQGSRMIPYTWFLALERVDGRGLFSSSDSLSRYGFIPAEGPSELNPDALPIGFAIDPVEIPGYGRYLGLTCAACHTGDVQVQGKTIRIDGGPANLDFDNFYQDLATAVRVTAYDPARFQRFAARLLPQPTPEAVGQLQKLMVALETNLSGDAAVREAATHSGFGRVDALTQIVNALSVTAQSDPANMRPELAPTSYPHLWLAPQLEFVQWNPIAASPIGRNLGEVLGVFGTTTLTGPQEGWFKSSALVRNLHALEMWVADLEAPPWDEEIFGARDMDLAGEGETLFKDHCAGCHNMAPYRMTDPADNFFGKSFIEIGRVDYRKVGTDPTYMHSLIMRFIRTNEATATINDGQPIVPAAAFFLKTVGAVVMREMNDLDLTPEERAVIDGFRLRPPAGPDQKPQPYAPPSVTDMKASPLDGIWATGPFLHNGSVPTVYELLSPVAERRKVFWTGGRELDRERLGFVSTDAPGRHRFDTSLPGNLNIGHLYPKKGLTHDERMAIIEYLKTM